MPLPIHMLVQKVVDTRVGKQGFRDSRLLTDWPRIAGAHLVDRTLPRKITRPKSNRGKEAGATLHLWVLNGHALLIQHEIPLLQERINRYLGYHAVTAVKLIQVHTLPSSARGVSAPYIPPPAQVDRRVQQQLEDVTKAVRHDALAKALQSLGASILTRQNKHPRKAP